VRDDVGHLVLVLAVPEHDGASDGVVAGGRGDAEDDDAGAVLLQLRLAPFVECSLYSSKPDVAFVASQASFWGRRPWPSISVSTWLTLATAPGL